MADYAIPGDADELFPDSGFAVVVLDEFKPPDSEDFINILGPFDTVDDVVLPAAKTGYSYYIHSADGETYLREDWPPDDLD